MKYTFIFCIVLNLASVSFSQSTFQSTLQAGVSLPVNKTNDVYTSEGIHFGNHLDFLVGNRQVKFGLGGYAGYLNSFSSDIAYKATAEDIARKFGLSSNQLTFDETAFKSFSLLLGPVLSFGKNKYSFSGWAKGGYAFNEPATYAVLYREGNQVRNVYVNQSADNKNGFAYNAGIAFQYSISPGVGFQLASNYFASKTAQVSYNYEREQGTIPTYLNVKNTFIQASAGITLKFDKGRETQRINRSKSNVKNNRSSYNDEEEDEPTKNDRVRKEEIWDNEAEDILVFNPEKIVLSTRKQSQGATFGEKVSRMSAVNNYLTGFVHQTGNGLSIDQCGTSNDAAPAIAVTLTPADGNGGSVLNTSTNSDGSFAFKNIEPGHYKAQMGNETMDVWVKGDDRNNYTPLSTIDATCSNGTLHNIISINDTIFVEVISPRDTKAGNSAGQVVTPRDASSGLATGRRMHKPYRVSNTSFEISQRNIIQYNGKIYAEVKSSEENEGSDKVMIVGDLDGDGFPDNAISSPRDAASGLATGRRMHESVVIKKELNATEHSVKSPRDPASGLATGKRMHKPISIIIEVEETENNIQSPRDASSGLATGRRMHKPIQINLELGKSNNIIVSPKDMASGLPTGKRMHKPVTIILELDENNHTIVSPRDASSGMATGRRTHKPIHITLDLDEVAGAIVSPRDASSGLATGKRQHKPITITLDLNEVSDATMVNRDAASGLATGRRQHKPVSIIIELDADDQMIVSPRDPASGLPTGKRLLLATIENNMDSESTIVNPLFEGGSNSGTNPMFRQGNGNQSPLYDAKGKQQNNPLSNNTSANGKGENPLFEATSDLRIVGSNGIKHTVMISNILEVAIPANTLPGQQYNVMPVKWSPPEPNSERKGINQAGVKKVIVRGWDSEKREGIATTYILQTSRISCDAGYCKLDCVVEINGILYDAVISGNFESVQDSGKGFMNIIR